MIDAPKCPGCGREMELISGAHLPGIGYPFVNYRAVYVCNKCGWRAPLALSDKCMADAEKSAFEQAALRTMQRPLKLTWGMLEECDDNGLVPFFMEHRFTGEINAGIYDSRNDMLHYDMGEAESDWIDNEEQGKTWRAWARRPTDEERKMAMWEGVSDEHWR